MEINNEIGFGNKMGKKWAKKRTNKVRKKSRGRK